MEMTETEVLHDDVEIKTEVVKSIQFKTRLRILTQISDVLTAMGRAKFYQEGSKNRIQTEI